MGGSQATSGDFMCSIGLGSLSGEMRVTQMSTALVAAVISQVSMRFRLLDMPATTSMFLDRTSGCLCMEVSILAVISRSMICGVSICLANSYGLLRPAIAMSQMFLMLLWVPRVCQHTQTVLRVAMAATRGSTVLAMHGSLAEVPMPGI